MSYFWCQEANANLPTPGDWFETLGGDQDIGLDDIMSDYLNEHYNFSGTTQIARYWDGDIDHDFEDQEPTDWSCIDCGTMALVFPTHAEWEAHVGRILGTIGWLRCPEVACGHLVQGSHAAFELHRDNEHAAIFPTDPGDTIPVFDATWQPTRIEPPTTHENW